MKALLMHRDRDFDLGQAPPWNHRALAQDLALDTLLNAIARGDDLVRQVAAIALLGGGSNDVATILHRQAVTRDALRNPAVVREIYDLTIEAIANKRKGYFGLWGTLPSSVLSGAIAMVRMYVAMLRRLRGIARQHGPAFESDGFRGLFAMLERELDDEYLAGVESHLDRLRFGRGIRMSAQLGAGNRVCNQVLHAPTGDDRTWLQRLLARREPGLTYRLAERDEAGARALSDIRDRGIHAVANALAQSADHIDGFFKMLRAEVAFYVGCLNLHERLVELREPTCFPQPRAAGERRLRCRELYDPCLALEMQQAVVGNTIDASGKPLVVVTGANQGGKSTFLRALGVAQLMMQSGMFVAAESFEGELCPTLVTHYKREEDPTMKAGKLDEELARMSEIVDHLAPNAIVLFNESFAATNEREGSAIAQQVVSALVERRIKVVFVTHLFEFAHGLFDRGKPDASFLRAEREPDGTRTFRLVAGEPLATSYGRDLYERIFSARPPEARHETRYLPEEDRP
jgi:hypothetical protein